MTNFKLDSSKIPKEFHSVSEIFKDQANIRLVGGAVRDLVIGNNPNDLDFAIDISPEKVMEICQSRSIPYIPIGLPHGTVALVIDGKRFEITTLRVDVKSLDGRHAEVAFTDDWAQDAARRDFTINALSMDNLGNVFDYFNGINDLQNRIVCFVGNPDKRIQEDGLRILRFFRFCGKLYPNSTPHYDFNSLVAIKRNIRCLGNVSRERISNELHKIIQTKCPFIWNEMKTYDLLSEICIHFSDNFDIEKIRRLLLHSKNNFELMIAYGAVNKSGLRDIRKKLFFSRNENKLLDFLVDYNKMTFNEENVIRLYYKDNIRLEHIELLSILNGMPTEMTAMIANNEFHKIPLSKTEVALSINNKSLTTKFYNRLVENFIQSNYKITKEELLDKLDKYYRNYGSGRKGQSDNKVID